VGQLTHKRLQSHGLLLDHLRQVLLPDHSRLVLLLDHPPLHQPNLFHLFVPPISIVEWTKNVRRSGNH
jgi:hypothetical protein